jgi:hypothetical protein
MAVAITPRRIVGIRRAVIGAGAKVIMAVAISFAGGKRRDGTEDAENGGNRGQCGGDGTLI